MSASTAHPCGCATGTCRCGLTPAEAAEVRRVMERHLRPFARELRRVIAKKLEESRPIGRLVVAVKARPGGGHDSVFSGQRALHRFKEAWPHLASDNGTLYGRTIVLSPDTPRDQAVARLVGCGFNRRWAECVLDGGTECDTYR